MFHLQTPPQKSENRDMSAKYAGVLLFVENYSFKEEKHVKEDILGKHYFFSTGEKKRKKNIKNKGKCLRNKCKKPPITDFRLQRVNEVQL